MATLLKTPVEGPDQRELLLRMVALSARYVGNMNAAPFQLEPAVDATLKGKTPDEPTDRKALLDDLCKYGFHVHRGTVWGLWRHTQTEALELVRLGEV
jgi:hypothetical protein